MTNPGHIISVVLKIVYPFVSIFIFFGAYSPVKVQQLELMLMSMCIYQILSQNLVT